jgi:GT2 family glycosyltransferase
MRPLVRVVVVNYNGGELLRRCLESVERVRWPRERLEIIVVDNASTDGSAEAVGGTSARLVRSPSNLGFGAGNNLALADLGEVDYVALLNNDALVGEGWLEPLVAALEADARLGAACPKILFAPAFGEIVIESPGFRPGGVDPRTLGVKVSGVRVNGADRFADAIFATGCYGLEPGPREERQFHWTAPRAAVWAPFDAQAERTLVSLRLAAERPKEATLRSGEGAARIAVDTRPRWFDVELRGDRFDVVQNAGSVVVDGGYCRDRGFQERDEGQFERSVEVFGWCGCSVLLRRRYLEDVGLFDPRLFLYYEDFDLSWRGRARGWRYRYVPGSVVRHVHAASTVEDSPLFIYQVERSRLLVHLKNAPLTYTARALRDSLRLTARLGVRDIVRPLLAGERPYTGTVRLRLRALGSVALNAPSVLADRRRLRRAQSVPDALLLAWRERR